MQNSATVFFHFDLKSIENKIKNNPKRSFWVVFSVLLVYQISLIFQGFELCDSGFYATFYQNIFSNPSSVETNFPFWFTGIIGGSFIKLFPDSGLLGIRLLGVINFSATIYIVYKLLVNHINNLALYIGLIVITISFAGTPREFYHNNLSSFLFVSALYTMYNGFLKKNNILFAFSGMLLALNIFTRLPNILDIGIIGILIIYSYYYKETNIICFKRIFFLLSGYALSIFCIFGIMKLIGHYDIFINSLKGLRESAVGEAGNTHNLSAMILMNIICYKAIVINGLKVTAIILLLAYFINIKAIRKLNWLAILLSLVILSYVITRQAPIITTYYFSIISLLWYIYTKDINIKILSWMGLFMLIVMPLGSDAAIWNFGTDSIWIAIPLTINLFMTEEFNIKMNVDSFTSNKFFNFQLDNYHIKIMMSIFLVAFISNIVYSEVNSAYFDPGNRINKTYKINSNKTKGIYTSQERATIVNNLLTGIKPFVKSGDYLIAYESIPMIYYLTNTRPFLHISWFIGISGSALSKKIDKIKKENKPLPMVIRQKFETIENFKIPSNEYISDNRKSTVFISNEQTRSFNKFLANNKYHIIWQNTHFILYAPQIPDK